MTNEDKKTETLSVRKTLSLGSRAPHIADEAAKESVAARPAYETRAQAKGQGNRTVAVEVKAKRRFGVSATEAPVVAEAQTPEPQTLPNIRPKENEETFEKKRMALRQAALQQAKIDREQAVQRDGDRRIAGFAAAAAQKAEVQETSDAADASQEVSSASPVAEKDIAASSSVFFAQEAGTPPLAALDTGRRPLAPTNSKQVVKKLEDDETELAAKRGGNKFVDQKVAPKTRPATENRRESQNRQVLLQLITNEEGADDKVNRSRSLASIRRARMKAKRDSTVTEKIFRDVILPEIITVQELANRMSERVVDVTKELMKLGVMVTPHQAIDADTAQLVIESLGHRYKRVAEDDIESILDDEEDPEGTLVPRPPVVTIMGHVDHGKTSLLDALRSTEVAHGEAGGITQHIGAYQLHTADGSTITFLDTPGHEAFTAMRARGAKATDIVILVVAADDGIMAQTVEAIHHARAANVPIIVAINKIDKPDADPQRVLNELLQHEVVAESFGGDVMTVEVSAKAGTNLDRLLELVLLQAEIMQLQANPNRAARGVVIESRVDRQRGPVATLLVQKGTFRPGDIVVAGQVWGRVRVLTDSHGRSLQKAIPGMPVEVLGLEFPPDSGETWVVTEHEKDARDISEFRERRARNLRTARVQRTSLEELFHRASAKGFIKTLPLVVKADVHGSAEAIAQGLAKIKHNEVTVKLLHSGVGAINESDVNLAQTAGGMVLGFNVRPTPKARELAELNGVDIQFFSIIYDLIDHVKTLLTGLLSPRIREQQIGTVVVRQVFTITKVGKVAGCFVTDGIVKRGSKLRIVRDNTVIQEDVVRTLRRFKDDVKEVRQGFECGVVLERFNDLRTDDILEIIDVHEEKATLED